MLAIFAHEFFVVIVLVYLSAVMTIIQMPMFLYRLATNFVEHIFLLGCC